MTTEQDPQDIMAASETEYDGVHLTPPLLTVFS
jgi:hypothetical protein